MEAERERALRAKAVADARAAAQAQMRAEAAAYTCAFYEKPMVGVASHRWTYRGPAAERIAVGKRKAIEDAMASRVQSIVRSYLVRTRQKRKAEALVRTSRIRAIREARSMVAKLNQNMLIPQAQLAWAYNTEGAVNLIEIERTSKKQSLGVDASLPQQLELEYPGLDLLRVSETFMRIDRVKVSVSECSPGRTIKTQHNNEAHQSITVPVDATIGCLCLPFVFLFFS